MKNTSIIIIVCIIIGYYLYKKWGYFDFNDTPNLFSTYPKGTFDF